MFLADRLKKCREEKGLSYTDLLFELGNAGLRISRPTFINWESGATAPDGNEIAVLASFFNKPVQYFFARPS